MVGVDALQVLDGEQSEAVFVRLDGLGVILIVVLVGTADHGGLFFVLGVFVGHGFDNGYKFGLVVLGLLQILLEQVHPLHYQLYPILLLRIFPGRLSDSLEVGFFALGLDGFAELFQFFVDADEEFADAADEGVEGSPHVLLELEDDGWLLLGGAEEGGLEDIVGDGDEFFILAVQDLDLGLNCLVLLVLVYDDI